MRTTMLSDTAASSSLLEHFASFRANTLGEGQRFLTPFGEKQIIYADWTASGRLYRPIEELLLHQVAPFVGNTHTDTTVTGSTMTAAYHEAKHIIKAHVGANERDVLIASHSGMTGVVNKFQRILGLKVHEKFQPKLHIPSEQRPIVFISHMEHHSNQTTWLETIAEVEIIPPDEHGLMDLEALRRLLAKYEQRELKIAAITSCSNVTGIITPYHEVAQIMHEAGGLCFVDFACSAPYININMHPANPAQALDAIYFSPHKFLGGPGSSGILIFNAKLYNNRIPDNPGGGTVQWTNPWGEHSYLEEIEAREDGGTPAFLQTMRAAFAIRLKEKMQVEKMLEREHQQMEIIFQRLEQIPNLHILAHTNKTRLGVMSFYIDDLHYNLGVKLLNDHFGIQVRGGCSCAGTYGHYLLNVPRDASKNITSRIESGDLSYKPGWIRLSIHPIMSNEEITFILDAVEALAKNHALWAQDYDYDVHCNEFYHKKGEPTERDERIAQWFL